MRAKQPSRLYQNHHFDSTRWRWFESRADDIVIATSYKAGTTWTQAIVANLLFPDGDFPSPAEVSRGARLIKSAENANETLPQARKVPRGPVEPRSTA